MWEELKSQIGTEGFPSSKHREYGRILDVLERGQRVLDLIGDPNQTDWVVADLAIGKFERSLGELGQRLPVSKKLVQHLMNTQSHVYDEYNRTLKDRHAAKTNSFQRLEKLLIANRLSDARQDWEELSAQGLTPKLAERNKHFEATLELYESMDVFWEEVEAYDGTAPRWSSLKEAFENFDSTYGVLPSPIWVEADTGDHLNEKKDEVYDRINAIHAEREQGKADFVDEVVEAAVAQGFKGFNREVGPARFLKRAMRGWSLEEGLNQVFHTQYSDWKSGADDNFELGQIVDGWQIYDYSEWTGSDWIRFSIAVPDNGGMTMEGQRLPVGYYVFEGPIEFTTVAGVSRRIQAFRPVDLGVE